AVCVFWIGKQGRPAAERSRIEFPRTTDHRLARLRDPGAVQCLEALSAFEHVPRLRTGMAMAAAFLLHACLDDGFQVAGRILGALLHHERTNHRPPRASVLWPALRFDGEEPMFA